MNLELIETFDSYKDFDGSKYSRDNDVVAIVRDKGNKHRLVALSRINFLGGVCDDCPSDDIPKKGAVELYRVVGE